MINLCLPIPKKPPLSLQFGKARNILGHSFEKKSLLICFESYQGIPYSHTGRVDREDGEHFANG